MPIVKENLHTYKNVETFLESIWSEDAALFCVTRNLVTKIKAYCNHMCKKCHFPEYQWGESQIIVLIKFWLNGLHFSFQDPQKAVSYLFHHTWIQR